MGKELLKDTDSKLITLAQNYALKKVTKDLEQLFQELEYKFNSLSSSRGDYPFIAFTLGHGKKEFEHHCFHLIHKFLLLITLYKMAFLSLLILSVLTLARFLN